MWLAEECEVGERILLGWITHHTPTPHTKLWPSGPCGSLVPILLFPGTGAAWNTGKVYVRNHMAPHRVSNVSSVLGFYAWIDHFVGDLSMTCKTKSKFYFASLQSFLQIRNLIFAMSRSLFFFFLFNFVTLFLPDVSISPSTDSCKNNDNQQHNVNIWQSDFVINSSFTLNAFFLVMGESVPGLVVHCTINIKNWELQLMNVFVIC